MNDESALSIDVLPLPVPPATTTLSFEATIAWSDAATSSVSAPKPIKRCDGERLLEEAPDRDVRAVRRGGREDRLDARAVGEAPFEDRAARSIVLADELRGVAERGLERLPAREARLGELEDPLCARRRS